MGTLLLAAFAAPLTEVAFAFGPAEYCALMVVGLIGAVVLASGSLIKAIAMIVLGLLMGLIGTDVNSGVARFSFDIPELTDGVGFVTIAMGVFGYGEIIANLSRPSDEREVFTSKVQGLFPTMEDFKRMLPAVIRGTTLGSLLGVLPGGGALLAAFAAYTIEKKTKLKPGEVPFGQGNIRGVAAPESANNAGAQTSFIPLLTLGIPPNAVMALMVGALTTLDEILVHPLLAGHPSLAQVADAVVVDMHCEASSEKQAMGYLADGRATLVVGTHTHVPTADTRILTQGTAYQTDAGMTGPYQSVIGVDKQIILERFLTQMPVRMEAARWGAALHAVIVAADETSGRATAVKRFAICQEK